MSEIKIIIEAPAIVKALNKLAEAIEPSHKLETAQDIPEKATIKSDESNDAATPTTEAPTPVSTPAPVTTPAQTRPEAVKSEEVKQPSVTSEALSIAGAALVDNGKMDELISLLNTKYGIQAITQLPKDKYDALAEDMRALGADI